MNAPKKHFTSIESIINKTRTHDYDRNWGHHTYHDTIHDRHLGSLRYGREDLKWKIVQS